MSLPAKLTSTKLLRDFFLIFVVLFLGNAIVLRWDTKADKADFSVESTRTAAALLQYGEFRDPYAPMPTGLSSHSPPAYPLLYAGIVKVLGAGRASWWAIRVLTLAVYALHLALLPVLAVTLNLTRLSGLIAAWMGVLIPIPGSIYKWETAFTALFLVVLALLTAKWCAQPQSNVIASTLGVTWGVALLFCPTVLLVWIAWAVIACVFARRIVTFRAIAVVCILPVLVIAPWLHRSYKVFHALIPLRDNFGLELAASNNDCASGWATQDRESSCFALVHPNASAALDKRILEVGEYRFNAERMQTAREWIVGHPWNFARLCIRRFLFFWMPIFAPVRGPAFLAAASISAVTLLSIPGLFVIFRRSRLAASLAVACLVFYPPAYYLAEVELRFRYPIFWIALLASGCLITAILRSPSAPLTEPRR
jgi:hypothetical protein